MRRTAAVLSLLLPFSAPATAEVVAKTHAWTWTVSLEKAGEPGSTDCTLQLVGETYQLKHQTSLKREGVSCDLYGPVNIVVSNALAVDDADVYVEAARGGDGDHSGPIVEVFRLTKQGFKKLGEKELFDASYRRSGDLVTEISAKVLFSLCDVCDGPDVASPADKIFVPVQVTVGCDGLCVKPTLNPAARQALLAKFQKRKAELFKDNPRPEYERYLADLEKELRSLLAQ